jgi:hypothetical protein
VAVARRFAILLVLVVFAGGGFMAAELSSQVVPQAQSATPTVHEPPRGPVGCAGVSCNKGAPSPLTPPTNSLLLWVVLTSVLCYWVMRTRKILRTVSVSLPRGAAAVLFHPPRFSRSTQISAS